MISSYAPARLKLIVATASIRIITVCTNTSWLRLSMPWVPGTYPAFRMITGLGIYLVTPWLPNKHVDRQKIASWLQQSPACTLQQGLILCSYIYTIYPKIQWVTKFGDLVVCLCDCQINIYFLHTIHLEIFTNFATWSHWTLLCYFFLSCVEDCIEDMAPLVKICSTKFFCNTKVAELDEVLSNENFHVYGILHTAIPYQTTKFKSAFFTKAIFCEYSQLYTISNRMHDPI